MKYVQNALFKGKCMCAPSFLMCAHLFAHAHNLMEHWSCYNIVIEAETRTEHRLLIVITFILKVNKMQRIKTPGI